MNLHICYTEQLSETDRLAAVVLVQTTHSLTFYWIHRGGCAADFPLWFFWSFLFDLKLNKSTMWGKFQLSGVHSKTLMQDLNLTVIDFLVDTLRRFSNETGRLENWLKGMRSLRICTNGKNELIWKYGNDVESEYACIHVPLSLTHTFAIRFFVRQIYINPSKLMSVEVLEYHRKIEHYYYIERNKIPPKPLLDCPKYTLRLRISQAK